MDIYTIVKDPKNAPLAILDLILAPLALAGVANGKLFLHQVQDTE